MRALAEPEKPLLWEDLFDIRDGDQQGSSTEQSGAYFEHLGFGGPAEANPANVADSRFELL